jgi:hypothetical protein
MFENDYTLVGKHATYVKYFVNEAKLFERYIDVYMNAALFGLLHNRTAQRDKESTDRARIYADAFANCRSDCVFLYRLVMLLDKTTDLETPERIDRAFRDDANEQEPEKLAANMEVFNAYVRGGIEEMYEQFIDGHGSNPDEYLERAMDVMEEFKDDISGSDFEDRLRSLI